MHTLPATTGIGLKPQHYEALLNSNRSIDWLEVHPENYMGKGGIPHRYLEKIRENYSLSMHGVGMSLGSVDGIDDQHLSKLKQLVDRYQPSHVSEHLSWSHWQSTFLSDLLPLPYNEESLRTVCNNIDKVQSSLKQSILIENPSSYIDFNDSEYSEPEFLNLIAQRCDCQILLDINNIFVSAYNNAFDPHQYLEDLATEHVKEIHLAGHSIKELCSGSKIRIDDHGSEVKDEVWALFRHFFSRESHALPTLIEWDTDIPELEVLLQESQKANQHMDEVLASARQ